MSPAPGPWTLVVTQRNKLILTELVRLQICKNTSLCTDPEYLICLCEEEVTSLFLYHFRGSDVGSCLNAETGTLCQSSYSENGLLWDFSSWYSTSDRRCEVSLKLPLCKRLTGALD